MARYPLLDISPQGRLLTIAFVAVMFGAWLLGFLFANVPAAATFTTVLMVHLVLVWVVFVLRLRSRAVGGESGDITLVRLFLFLAVNVVAFSTFHATIELGSVGSYGNIPAGTTLVGLWGLGTFIAIETLSSLGSGTIIARAPLAFFAIALNNIASILFLTLAAAMIFNALQRKQEQTREERRQSRRR